MVLTMPIQVISHFYFRLNLLVGLLRAFSIGSIVTLILKGLVCIGTSASIGIFLVATDNVTPSPYDAYSPYGKYDDYVDLVVQTTKILLGAYLGLNIFSFLFNCALNIPAIIFGFQGAKDLMMRTQEEVEFSPDYDVVGINDDDDD